MSEKKWYIVYVGDQRRISVLPFALNSQPGDYSVWVPTRQLYQKIRGKIREISRPLFPGYVFLNIDLGNGTVEESVKNICGGYLLRSPGSDDPTFMTADEIEHLRSIVRDRQAPESLAEQHNLDVGQEVEVTTGPFLGHRGKITMVKKDTVVVEVTIFNRAVEAEVDPSSCHPN